MAVISTEQNVFLSARNDMPSVAIPTSVFPTKAAAKQLLGGIQVEEVQNYNGTKAIGSHGRKSLLMWRAAVEGLLERAALFYTRDSDAFHTQELQGGNTQQTNFAGCYIDIGTILKVGRNDALSDPQKRRWLHTKLYQSFLNRVHYGLFFREYYFGGRKVHDTWDASWTILPPIMTTTEEAQSLIAQDITNANALVDRNAARNLIGSALEHFPCGSVFFEDDGDALFAEISHNTLELRCGGSRVDSSYPSLSYFIGYARGLYDGYVLAYEEVSYRRRIAEQLACCVNLFDLARIGLWLARPCYYANSREQPRQLFVHKSVTRNVSISASWSGENDFDISIGNSPASETPTDTGRYAKYGYNEGVAAVSHNRFDSRWLYSARDTIGGVINSYFYNPEEAWLANYFSLVETRTIPGGSSRGREGTFVWISGANLAALIQRLIDGGWYAQQKIETNGSLSCSKSFSGTWTDGASGSAYFADVDYPCEFAIDNNYVKLAKEWLFGVGYCEVNFDGSDYERIYDALKATGGTVKTNRQTAAAEIVAKYLADIWRGFGKISSRKMLGSLDAMKDWMNSFGFAPDSSYPFFTLNSLRDALYAAREAAVWNFQPYYCFVGTNEGSQRFYGWGGLWYASSVGAPDDYMTQISPEDSDVWGLYELAEKSFAVPVWCRDFATSFEPYQSFTAKGEIESWIGAFDWAFKAIAHN